MSSGLMHYIIIIDLFTPTSRFEIIYVKYLKNYFSEKNEWHFQQKYTLFPYIIMQMEFIEQYSYGVSSPWFYKNWNISTFYRFSVGS